MKSRNREAFGLVLLVCIGAGRLQACGPFFPNNLLDGGDAAVLVAPVAYFSLELKQMRLAPAEFRAVPATNGYANQSARVEMHDLQAAMAERAYTPTNVATLSGGADLPVGPDARQRVPTGVTAATPAFVSGRSEYETERILKQHLTERKKLATYVQARRAWENSAPWQWDASATNYVRGKPPGAPPEFPHIVVMKGLPAEFADYFAGAVAWDNPALTNKTPARQAWERVLQLPAAQRHFKSTWAAFMLGKSWMEENPEKAKEYFRQVRSLARHGFADSCGLAAASLGLEARIDLQTNKFREAFDLYLDQMATGDPSAVNSLDFTASRALRTADSATLQELAADPKSQRVITAYLISSRADLYENALAGKWLEAVETARVRDVDSAEKLALAAYQSGEWTIAQRWINRAPQAPVAQWLQAKLLLRAGKVDQAAAELVKVARLFPLATNTHRAAAGLKDDLIVAGNVCATETANAPNHVLGELGVLHLARREYVEALDALLRAGFWMDAAYVAERVLTVNELKTYVDLNWPEKTGPRADSSGVCNGAMDARAKIRYLLARRLAREHRDVEAVAYYPGEWRPQFGALRDALAAGRDETLPPRQRAAALFTAALITRTNGMELLGTEVAPDWHMYGGDFESGVCVSTRTNGAARLLVPARDELARAERQDVIPEKRFHYRYQAADLAMEAADLMPDHSNETARVLCTAGSWIKYRDPQAADPIYKELVRRCGQTAIGMQADRMRWFPLLDSDGNPVPYVPRPERHRSKFEIQSLHMFGRRNGWAQCLTPVSGIHSWKDYEAGVLQTTNGGMSWTPVLCGTLDDKLEAFFYDAQTAWTVSIFEVASNITILHTVNGGRSWTHTELHQLHYGMDCRLSFPTPLQGWLMFIPDHGMNSSPGDLYRTDDGGEHWRKVNGTEGNPYEGDNYTQEEFERPHSYLSCGGDITFLNTSSGWLWGSMASTVPGYLFMTRDGGLTWQVQVLPLPSTLQHGRMVPCSLPHFFASPQKAGILVTQFIPAGRTYGDHHVVYHTHDNGLTWQPAKALQPTGIYDFISDRHGWLWSPEIHDTDSTAPVKGTLYRTDDGGDSWTIVAPTELSGAARTNPPESGQDGQGANLETFLTHGDDIVQLDFVDDDCGWAITRNPKDWTQLLETRDGGRSWRQRSF